MLSFVVQGFDLEMKMYILHWKIGMVLGRRISSTCTADSCPDPAFITKDGGFFSALEERLHQERVHCNNLNLALLPSGQLGEVMAMQRPAGSRGTGARQGPNCWILGTSNIAPVHKPAPTPAGVPRGVLAGTRGVRARDAL